MRRNVVLERRKTTVNLEDTFWTELNKIAGLQGVSRSKLSLKFTL